MQLSAFLQGLIHEPNFLPNEADFDVKNLALDSRKITENSVFFALPGTQLDGRKYITDAIKNGAKAVLIEAENEDETVTFIEKIPLIPVTFLRHKMGVMAAKFYDFPAQKLRILGVTGTSGKTSCTHFFAQILQNLGQKCGVIGTLGSGFYGDLSDVSLTTPDAISLQAKLHLFVQEQAKAVSMEVSSHSIDQGRVNGVTFELGIFTNLTQDHLDYHGDMATYAAVKHRFLTHYPMNHLIMNIDDVHGRQWVQALADKRSVFAYSTQPVADLPGYIPHIYTDQIQLSLSGIRAHVYSPWGEGELQLPLIGQFNLSNALAVLTALCVYGVPFQTVLTEFAKLKSVPGRMQLIGEYHQPLVIVDYSHKPDSLANALQALRAHVAGQLICVFGCGGNRDAGKRPIMAKIAETFADTVIVTNDNPRHEDPEEIARQIMQGFERPDQVIVELDRAKAIQKSIQLATIDDCILVAGKGAEQYQQIGDEKIPFDDVTVAQSFLKTFSL
ncbi:MAG: hypothetical protein ACD_46C00143G0002 [uncultured bacterium]|nr:MAG: hypothetical protein ACD_46C00143G0002 [uncultured bacterium]